MKQVKTNKQPLEDRICNEIKALKNALDSLNLTGFTIHEAGQRLKGKYFLRDKEGNSLTGYWDYVRLNHFIMGYGKAFNKFVPDYRYTKLSEVENKIRETPIPDSKEGLHTQVKKHEWHESNKGPLNLSLLTGRPCICKVLGKTESQATKNNNAILKAVNERQALLDALGDLIDYLGKDWKDDEEVKKAKLIFNNAKNI